MSRLLQALKNLEARSPQPAAARPPAGKGLLAHLADKFHSPSADRPPPAAEVAAPARPTPIKPPPQGNPLAYLSAGMPTIVLSPPAAPDVDFSAEDAYSAQAFSPVYVNELVPPLCPPPPVLPPEPLPEPAAAKPIAAAPPPREQPVAPSIAAPRQATLIERTIRRALADPARSEPFRQLADRLLSDLEASGGRSIVITGIGPASETHEVILHTAAVLAERGEPILVVDADAAHRALTCQLDLPACRGLVEALRPEHDPLALVQPTAFESLSVLPLGQARLGDPAAAANRLAAVVQTLEASYRLVLIDGGRSSELAAATLARLSDATYFVVRLGQTEAALAQAAVRDFRAAGARVLGCIATS